MANGSSGLSPFITAEAKLIFNEGECGKNGDNITYILDEDGLLTITGSGEMANSPSFRGDTRIKKAVISDGITTIGNYAFSNCSQLLEITIPDTVTRIGYDAFSNSGLVSVNIPEGVTVIDLSTFENCSRLSEVHLPSTLTEISTCAFRYCYSLRNIDIPYGVTLIDFCAFDGSGLETISLPETLTEIGSSAFADSNLTELNIPNSLTKIGKSAFYQTCMKNIVIPDGVTEIAGWAFANMRVPVESIIIGNNVKTIGEICFNDPYPSSGKYKVTNIVIPDSVETIGRLAFQIPTIRNVYIGKGLKEFKDAFMIDKVQEIVVDPENPYIHSCDNVLYNSDYSDIMFLSQNRTGKIIFPKELKSIVKNYTFESNALGISDCDIEEGAENFTAVDGVLYTKDMSTLYYCPDKRTKKVVVPAEVEKIQDYACQTVKCEFDFSNCHNLTEIGEQAFRWAGAGDLVLPEGLEKIGRNSFAYSKFKSLDIPDSLPLIRYTDFCLCDAETVRIGSGANMVRESADASGHFFGTKTYSIEVSEDNPYIASYKGTVFTKDFSQVIMAPYAKNEIYLPKETQSFICEPYNNYATYIIDEENPYLSFDGTFLMNKEQTVLYKVRDIYEDVVLPSTIVAFGDKARHPFRCVNKMKTLTLPEGFREFLPYSSKGGTQSIMFCDNLTTINFPSTLKEIRGISSCSKLKTLNIPEGVESIHDVSSCSGIRNLILPKSFKYLELTYDPGNITVKNPDCTIYFYTKLTSSTTVTGYCGSTAHKAATYRNSKFVSLGHKWLNDWYVHSPASYTEEGIEWRDCAYCDDHDVRTIPKLKKDTNTATFMADGKVVGTVEFYDTMTEIEEPAVPHKDRYTGEWEPYTLGNEDITINAKYTLIKADEAEDIKTDTDIDYYYETDDVQFNIKAYSAAKTIKSIVSKSVPLDIVLVVDQSGSMDNTLGGTQKKVDALKEAATNFVNQVAENAKQTKADHRIAITGFGLATKSYSGYEKFENTELLTTESGEPINYTDIKNSDYRNAMVNVLSGNAVNPIVTTAINNIAARGATAADYGLEMAKSIYANTDSTDRERIVVFMTDGEPTYSSGFETTVANNAISNASVLKKTYNAAVYSVGVFEAAQKNNANIKKFMNAVSSDYPDATSMTKLGNVQSEHYFITVDNTEALSNVFKTITTESLSHTAAFDNITIIKTLSKYVTLTSTQEQELRVDLIREYGITNDDIRITRNADGTTEIKVNNLTPKETTDDKGDISYEVSFSFFASLNENAKNAASYEVDTEDSGVMLGADAQGYEATFKISSVTLENDKNRVVYVVNGSVYAIIEDGSDPKSSFPSDWSFSGWSTNGNKKTGTLTKPQRTVKWNIDGEIVTQYYTEGMIITPPTVEDKADGAKFLSWNKSIPTVMPDKNLEFVAVFGDHVHKYTSETEKAVTCEEDGITRYVCSCGDAYTETVTKLGHNYEAITSSVDDSDPTKCTFVCTHCGTKYDYALKYQVKNSSRWSLSKILYEFDLTDDSNQIDVQPDGVIYIRVPLSELQYNTSNIKVVRTVNGIQEEVPSKIEDGFLVIEADHFTPYEIIFNEDVLIGDVNEDGIVNIKDATCIQKYLAALPVNMWNEKAADTDEDGVISIMDATNIQKYLVGFSCQGRIGEIVNK